MSRSCGTSAPPWGWRSRQSCSRARWSRRSRGWGRAPRRTGISCSPPRRRGFSCWRAWPPAVPGWTAQGSSSARLGRTTSHVKSSIPSESGYGSGSGSGSRVFIPQKLEKIQLKFFKISLYDQKLQITCPMACLNGQAKRSFQPSKENTSKNEMNRLFSIFVVHFCPPGSGSGLRIRIHGPHWIRIQSGYTTMVCSLFQIWPVLFSTDLRFKVESYRTILNPDHTPCTSGKKIKKLYWKFSKST